MMRIFPYPKIKIIIEVTDTLLIVVIRQKSLILKFLLALTVVCSMIDFMTFGNSCLIGRMVGGRLLTGKPLN